MSDFSDLLVKIAQNKPLTPGELADLGRFGNDTQNRNSFIGGNTTPGGALNVVMPFAPIFSEVLQTTTPSLTIPIPGGYKHLMIIGNGRTTTTGSVAEDIICQFNGDSAANYDLEVIYRLNNVSSGNQNLSFSAVPIGTFSTADADASVSGNCVAFIPNIQSSFFKGSTAIAGGYFTAAAGAIVSTDFGQWESTAVIQSVKILPLAGSFAAGTAISVYGLL